MDKQHYIQLKNCSVVLTSSEINQLLLKDTELFKKALKRSKGINRRMKQRDREKAIYEREKEGL